MGCDSSASITCSSVEVTCSPPNGKRSREPEDEVYLDNFQSHKRYLSEVMASSLNGLTVGDSLVENLMESPALSDSTCHPRDEFSPQCSPVSEDSDDSQYYDTTSYPTSPVSPHRHQRVSPAWGSISNLRPPSPSTSFANAACSHPRLRGSDSDGIRFPPSPNDVCHNGDLRRTALLRSVQMRAHPHCPVAYELPFGRGQEGEDRLCLSREREAADYIDGCSTATEEESQSGSQDQ